MSLNTIPHLSTCILIFYKCGICAENIGKSGSLQCCLCAIWLHSSCCGVPDRELVSLKANKNFNYCCTACCKSPRDSVDSSVKNEIAALTGVINNFIKKAEEEQTSVKTDLNNLDKKLDTFIAKLTMISCLSKRL